MSGQRGGRLTKTQESKIETDARKGKPLLAVTMGDPSGVGPEIVALALEDEQFMNNCVVIGDIKRLRAGARKAGSTTRYKTVRSPSGAEADGRVPVLQVDLADSSIPFGKLSGEGGGGLRSPHGPSICPHGPEEELEESIRAGCCRAGTRLHGNGLEQWQS